LRTCSKFNFDFKFLKIGKEEVRFRMSANFWIMAKNNSQEIAHGHTRIKHSFQIFANDIECVCVCVCVCEREGGWNNHMVCVWIKSALNVISSKSLLKHSINRFGKYEVWDSLVFSLTLISYIISDQLSFHNFLYYITPYKSKIIKFLPILGLT